MTYGTRSVPNATIPHMQASVDHAYTGVNLKRSLYLGDNYLIVHDRIHSSRFHTYDWVYHNYGNLISSLSLKSLPKSPGNGNGYEYLESLQQTMTNDSWQTTWQRHPFNVRLTMLGSPNTQVITAQGPGMPLSERLPMVIARRKGTQTGYITVLEWYEKQPILQSLTLTDNILRLVFPDKTTTLPLSETN